MTAKYDLELKTDSPGLGYNENGAVHLSPPHSIGRRSSFSADLSANGVVVNIIPGSSVELQKVNAAAAAPAADVNEHDEEGGGRKVKEFVKSTGLTTAEAEVLLAKYGRNELEEVKIPKWYIFVSQLWQVRDNFPQ